MLRVLKLELGGGVSGLSDAVEPVRLQVEEAALTLQADGQAGVEFVAQMSGVQAKVDEIQTLLRNVTDAVQEAGIMMTGIRAMSTQNMNRTGSRTEETVHLLDAVLRVVGDSDNEHARAAAENVDTAHSEAAVSARLHKAIRRETIESSLFLNEIRESIGTVAAKLTAFYDRTTSMQDTGIHAIAASEAAATKTSAAAQELEFYEADIA